MDFPRTKKEIATHLEIHRCTLSRRLDSKKIKISRGHIPPQKVREIYSILGYSEELQKLERRLTKKDRLY